MTLNLIFCQANRQDAEQLTHLINSAYRGEFSRQGWTTETDLIDGLRTNNDEVLQLIADDHSLFVLAKVKTELQGSVLLQNTTEGIYLSMLAVNPLLQGLGIGKALLQTAEIIAKQTWSANRLLMSVISCRHELINFYERRGYRQTGISQLFPAHTALWTAKVENLHLLYLEKLLQPA